MDLQVLKNILNGKPLAHLEKELGFSNGSVAKWERTSPSIDKVKKVADYFNVSTDYLLTGKEPLPAEIPDDQRELLAHYTKLDDIAKAEVRGYVRAKAER